MLKFDRGLGTDQVLVAQWQSALSNVQDVDINCESK